MYYKVPDYMYNFITLYEHTGILIKLFLNTWNSIDNSI
jgi:hypothetical protein